MFEKLFNYSFIYSNNRIVIHSYISVFAGVSDNERNTTAISSDGRDTGFVAGIVIIAVTIIIIFGALVCWKLNLFFISTLTILLISIITFQIAYVVYKHYLHRNVTSMNFDNPVYRKTTEDQFSLEKNGYAPGTKLYPSTVGEEVRALTTREFTQSHIR